FEHESVVELVAEPAHRVVELEPVLPVHEKGGVHYHAFAHDLVRPCLVNERSNASENRLLIARALLRQGVLDLLTKADALIVRFRRRTSVEGVAHPANRLVLPHHFGHRGALVPERLEPHLDPAAHLLEQFGGTPGSVVRGAAPRPSPRPAQSCRSAPAAGRTAP